MNLESPISSRITVDGCTYLYFGGTAYLGIPQNKGFLEHYQKGLEKFGINNGTSRSNNVQLSIYDEAEAHAAKFFKAEDALITSSGYLAAQLTVRCLADGCQVRYSPETHPALWLDKKPEVTLGFDEWGKDLVREINSSSAQDWLIVSNSLNNLDPLLYNFEFLAQLDGTKRITLIVDDSHGLGLINQGLGMFSSLLELNNISIVVVASMAKALGIDAGLILSDKKLIAKLKSTPTFLGASPPAAAALFAFINSQTIYREEQTKLSSLTSYFKTYCERQMGWKYVPEFPVFLSSQNDIGEKLKEEKILISAFPYPDSSGPVISRIVLSSWHSVTDIDFLILALQKISNN